MGVSAVAASALRRVGESRSRKGKGCPLATVRVPAFRWWRSRTVETMRYPAGLAFPLALGAATVERSALAVVQVTRRHRANHPEVHNGAAPGIGVGSIRRELGRPRLPAVATAARQPSARQKSRTAATGNGRRSCLGLPSRKLWVHARGPARLTAVGRPRPVATLPVPLLFGSHSTGSVLPR